MVSDLVPLVIGILASPFPVIPVILLLLTPRATANAVSFLGGWARGLLGGVLVVVGVRAFLARRANAESPGWMRALGESTPPSALRLGALLSGANPKILLLSAAAGLTIAAEEQGTAATVATVIAFALVGSLSVALPIGVHLVLGDRAQAPLRRAEAWLTTHNATIMAVVVLVIGALLLSKGLSGI